RSRLLEDGEAGARRLPLGALAPAPRDLRALLPRLAQPDGDRLLAARHTLAAPSALERSALATTHRRLDRLARTSAVPRHLKPPFVATALAWVEPWVACPRCAWHRTPDQSVWPGLDGRGFARPIDRRRTCLAWMRVAPHARPIRVAWPRRPWLRTPDPSFTSVQTACTRVRPWHSMRVANVGTRLDGLDWSAI